MAHESIPEIVDSERTQLAHGREEISDAVALRANRGNTVAKGLLVQGCLSEAQKWFDALSTEWLQRGEEIWETKFDQKQRQKAQMSPWHEYIMSLSAGLLGYSTLDDVAVTVADRVATPFVDELEQRATTYWIDLAGLLSSCVLETDSWNSYGSNLLDNVDGSSNKYAERRYPPYVMAINGINQGDIERIESGIKKLVAFHEEFVVDATDSSLADEALAFDASVVLALARCRGFDLDVHSEYVPAGLSDDDHYPFSV